MKTKVKETYYKNGQLHERYEVDEKGVKHGLYESWFENGQLRTKCTYQNDKKNGLYEFWDYDGQLKQKDLYIDDWYLNYALQENNKEMVFRLIQNNAHKSPYFNNV
jgi:antitoxin component YwqK of YwqJK toxin-antitoxin module